MIGFLQLGKRWINITSIHYVEIFQSSQEGTVCMVHFADKTSLSISGEQSQKLRDWLAKNDVDPAVTLGGTGS